MPPGAAHLVHVALPTRQSVIVEQVHAPAPDHKCERRKPDRPPRHAKGAADKAKGAVKDAVGGLTGNDKLQAEGKLDKAKGAAHNVAGNIKDAAKDLTK